MEESGFPPSQVPASRIPAPTWKTTTKSGGTGTPTRVSSAGAKSSGIRPPQVRTNPRFTRQGPRSKTRSESSNDSHPALSPTEPSLELGGAGGWEDPFPLSPSSLTRHGAFRYGRGVKPVEVLRLGSGAATLPRMRPKGNKDIRNSDIFASPEELETPLKDEQKNKASNQEDLSKREQSSIQTRKNPHKPQSVGRISGMKHQSQDRPISSKKQPADHGSTSGPRISKGIKAGSPPKAAEVSKVTKRPQLHSADHHTRSSSTADAQRQQRQVHNTIGSPRNCDKVKIDPKSSDAFRSLKGGHPTAELSPQVPPRRQRTLPTSSSGPSFNQSPVHKSSKTPLDSLHSKDQVKSLETPKPPPRRHKPPPLSPTASAIPKAIPTSTPRSQSPRHRAIQQKRPTLSPRNSLPSSATEGLSKESSLSYPQAGKGLGVAASVREREERQRSQSASHIPVHFSRRSSLPQHRPVKLRPKTSRSDRPNAIFRLSLEGPDSGTEYSSSLATTPSECSIDIDVTQEDTSPVYQTTPAKFYSISGLEEPTQPHQPMSRSSSELQFQQSEGDLSKDLPVEITHVSQRSPDNISWSQTWLADDKDKITNDPTEDVKISPSDITCDEDMSTMLEEETSKLVALVAVSPDLSSKTSTTEPMEEIKSHSHVQSTDHTDTEVHETESSTTVKDFDLASHQTTSIRNSKEDLGTLSEIKNPEKPPLQTSTNLKDTLPCQSDQGLPQANDYTRSGISKEIALRVARGDLIASSVDGDREASPHGRHSIKENLSAPHEEALSVTGDLTDTSACGKNEATSSADLSHVNGPLEASLADLNHSSLLNGPLEASSVDLNQPSLLNGPLEASSVDLNQPSLLSGPLEANLPPQSTNPAQEVLSIAGSMSVSGGTARDQGKAKPRRKFSSIQAPHLDLNRPGGCDSPQENQTRCDSPSPSGSGILETMMDREEAIPASPGRWKNSFHPYHRETSQTEEEFLQACSDPLKLLEFLMNIDDPPKLWGLYKGGRNGATVVKRRTKSDVVCPSERVVTSAGVKGGNRWSMPPALEQWSHSFWSYLTGNARSGQNSHTAENNTVPDIAAASNDRVSVTHGMLNTNRKANLTPRELYRIHHDNSTGLSHLRQTKGTSSKDASELTPNGSRHAKRWSIQVDTGNLLPSVGANNVNEPTEKFAGASAPSSKSVDQPLKRKSWWRWSLPVPLRRSPRIHDIQEHDPETHSNKLPGAPETSKLVHNLLLSSEETKKLDQSKSSSHSQKVGKRAPSFSDIPDSRVSSSTTNSVEGFADSTERNNGLHCLTSESSSLSSARNDPGVSGNHQEPVSPEGKIAPDESASSSVLLGDRDARSPSGPHLKKRLSWRSEKSLETVCYLERRDPAPEKEESEDECISGEEECNPGEPLSPHTPLGIVAKHQPKDGSDGVDSSYVLTDQSEDSGRACKTAPASVFSPWVLPPEELKSKLESVYAERQKDGLVDERKTWKLEERGSRDFFQLSSADQEVDLRASPGGTALCHPQEDAMRDAVTMSTGIGKRFSLKQQLSVDGHSELTGIDKETMGRLSRDSVGEFVSGSSSPVGDVSNNNQPKLSRMRSSSGHGTESLKDTRRKLDDVSHKTRLRIERDREIKTSDSPSSPSPDDSSETAPPRTNKPEIMLTLPDENQVNGRLDEDLNEDASLGESIQAFSRRKKSMAIALSEGLLDLQAEHASSLEKTSELQVVSQISQLNQELMQLTQQSPPGTPPTPCYHSKGSLQRSSSRGSLTSLPGITTKSSFPGMRLWKSVAHFQTAPDTLAHSIPDSSSEKEKPVPDMKRSTPLRSSLKEEEDTKEKTVSPKVLLSRIKQWSRKKQPKPKARPEIIKIDPEPAPEPAPEMRTSEDDEGDNHSLTQEKESVAPETNTTVLSNNIPEVPLRHQALLRPVPMIKDSTLRKTWHGMPSQKTSEDEEVEVHLGRSNFQRCNSLRNPIRQRKRGVSPMENAHLVAMQLSTETIPGSSVDSGIVKDRAVEEIYLAGDSDSSNFCSPCSSLSSSNPPSRPLSSDIIDLQWEKGSADGQDLANGGLAEERRLSAVTIGRRESGSGITKSRKPVVTRLSLNLSSPLPAEMSEGISSPKKVTFSLDEDLSKRAAQEDLKKMPKPLHLPRRTKMELADMKPVAGTIKEFEEEDGPTPSRSSVKHRAVTELSSICEKDPGGTTGSPPADKDQTTTASSPSKIPRPRSIPHHMSLMDGQGTETAPRKNSLADLIGTEVGDVLTSFSNQYNFEAYSPDTMPTFAEALWDHVTMDESELAFKAGDVIEVTDMRDRNWWWGCMGETEGWVPVQFVRLRVSQGETVEECVERLKEERERSKTVPLDKRNRKVSLSFLSNDQVRAKVVEEIITTERDYVRNLRDVCEGYISQALDRPEMFSEEVMNDLFGNIEEIYSFQKGFSLQLEASIIPERPHLSRIGGCFLEHKSGFETYSEYCNNYPKALRQLKQLREKQKYGQFFEACRLLQNMIEINLEGFLLTPVQKICKYPLQLRELLKYTRPQHADYKELQEALEVMKDVAVTINDRKRRIENIEKMAAWQKSIGDWEGEDLLEKSTQLVHSGDIALLAGKRWATARRVFLFDHQMVVCKKDWKGTLLYKKRIDLDESEVSDMPDGRDLQWNVTVKNAFKVHDLKQNRLHIFSCKTEHEKAEWLKLFVRERESVMKDREKGFTIPSAICEAAMKNVTVGEQPSKPQDLAVVTRKVSTMPYAYQHKILEMPNKKVPLPKGISSNDVFKKKGKGLFGIGKK